MVQSKNKQTYGVWLFIIHTLSFDNNKDKYDFYRGGDSRKRFCVNLKEHATEIINCEIKANKERGKIIQEMKNSVTHAKKNSMKIKTTIRSAITAITQGNIGGNT